MSEPKLHGVFLGLTITSTWGNGHATTYRALLKEFAALGHEVTFLERNVPWYESNREFSRLPYCDVRLYDSLTELKEQHEDLIRQADFVVIGSYVPEGIAVGDWVTATAQGLKAFYDIDTPVTLADLSAGKCTYLSRRLVSKYELYLSFTGGPTLTYLEEQLQSPAARTLYCSVDASLYYPEPAEKRWDLAYLGTYAPDRQPAVEKLFLAVAQQQPHLSFALAGPQYPESISWPANVERIVHLPAAEHRNFYNSQQFTLNLTRSEMVRSGYSPSVRLFEAAACGVPILTDEWPGLASVFEVGSEVLTVRTANDVVSHMQLSPERRQQIGENARKRTLRYHTAQVRARELESHLADVQNRNSQGRIRSKVAAARSETAALI